MCHTAKLSKNHFIFTSFLGPCNTGQNQFCNEKVHCFKIATVRNLHLVYENLLQIFRCMTQQCNLHITEECKQHLNMNTLTSFPFMAVAAGLIEDYYGTKLGYKKTKVFLTSKLIFRYRLKYMYSDLYKKLQRFWLMKAHQYSFQLISNTSARVVTLKHQSMMLLRSKYVSLQCRHSNLQHCLTIISVIYIH